jgi:hypothetical protein
VTAFEPPLPPRDQDREWVIAQTLRAIRMVARSHGRLYGLHELDVERLESLYLSRLTPSLVVALVERHGRLRMVGPLYAHVTAYMAKASANGRIFGAERANQHALDDEWASGASQYGSAHDEYLAERGLAEEELMLAAEATYAEDAERRAVRRVRRARLTLECLLAEMPPGVTASTVLRRATGASPASIAAEDGVPVNTVNQRLARWMRRLPPVDQACLAPLGLVTSNPAKGHRSSHAR